MTDEQQEMSDQARTVRENTLHALSKARYLLYYEDYENWANERGIPAPKLSSADALLIYVSCISQKYAASTLWTRMSAIKQVLMVKEEAFEWPNSVTMYLEVLFLFAIFFLTICSP